MNLEQPITINPQEAKHLRTIITAGLVLLLLAILAVYIYYGMRLATKTTNIEPLPEVVPPTPGQVEIINALENAPIASEIETEAVVKALEAATSTGETDRTAILDALH